MDGGGLVTTPAAVVCPECRDGKHGNCIGYALDPGTDTVVGCGCRERHAP